MTAANEARIGEGRTNAEAGNVPDAERSLRAVLHDDGVDDPAARFYALHYLATLYGIQGRAFESLTCARAASTLAARLDNDDAQAMSLPTHAASAAVAEHRDELERALDRLEAVLGRADRGLPDFVRQDYFEGRLKAALMDEDADSAVGHLARYERCILRRDSAGPVDRLSLAVLSSRVYLLLGEPDRAAAAFADAEATGRDSLDVSFELARIAVREAQRVIPAAQQVARKLLAQLEDLAKTRTHVYVRIEAGRRLMRFWDDNPAQFELDLRVRSLIAGAILERVYEVDAWARDLDLGEWTELPQQDDVVRWRKDFRREQRGALRAVAAALRDDPDALRVIMDRDGGGPHICAWCERLCSGTSGRWLPLGQYVPRDDFADISHGICPQCYAGMR